MNFNFSKIIKQGINSFGIYGASTIATLVLNWYLAKVLGAKDYGIFTYSFSWVFFFGAFTSFGYTSVVKRHIARYKAEKKAPHIKGLLLQGVGVTLVFSFVVSLLFFIITYFLNIQPNLKYFLQISIWALPIFALLLTFQAVFIGLKKVELSFLPEKLIRPLLLLIAAFIAVSYFNFNLTKSVYFNILAFTISLLFALVFFIKFYTSIKQKAEFDTKNWKKAGLVFFLTSMVLAINARADILLLGIFGHTADVGIYNIAVKFAQFISLPLFIANSILSPYISELHNNNKKDLALLIKKIIRIVFVLSFIATIIYFIFGNHILGYFGEEFKIGFWCLIILTLAQLFNVFVGPVGNILSMSNFEQLVLKSMIISTIINLILNLTLIPLYGINGAAISTAVGMAIWNLILFILVKKKLNINPSVI